jgi:hypothetical protein
MKPTTLPEVTFSIAAFPARSRARAPSDYAREKPRPQSSQHPEQRLMAQTNYARIDAPTR